MILAPGVPGVAFGSLADRDGRLDAIARQAIAEELGITSQWATIDQVHGSTVAPVDAPGHYGEADGLATATRGVPLVVATADCVPVSVVGDHTLALVHAGWRGVVAGIVPAAVARIEHWGDTVSSVVVGPHIGACCYEVGEEVLEQIGGHRASTTWGSTSVDLAAAIGAQVPDVPVVSVGPCTREDPAYASHRRDGSPERQIAVAWLP